ncbi:DNA mismatch repair endonuclease MutL [Sediminispirochaeta bajacaliforniensis]|uniref:DNA mismatch repair endonuclease MutL n=1 Tax=Sediminispirochaeta bajacaliforniensis TaxID=148 RepID=UPI0003606041|nr:DNA mismatch repair endonuclease MutL [Sediminispirochaeta bajacaliforniensis]
MERKQQDRSRSIHLLRDQVARKIAAGEVIDRPFSLLRELMDNAVDAGADTIDVHLTGGGTRSVRVVDNGCGMEREDLELCFLPHATSKISEVEDLDRITSLGFRGEALSSIAACSRLRITSAVAEGDAFTIEVDNGKLLSLQPSKGRKGTIVEASDLFYSIPARKRFLKSDQAELSACRKLFAEKALAFPEISFRLFSEGELKLFLPASSLIDRVTASYPSQVHSSMIHTIQGAGEGFRFAALGSGLSLYRKDRRYIHIYVNKRKIDEFSLVQAVSYGYGEYLPGGTFPVCFLFLEVDPERVDFNIHPAKKEVRFRGLKEIHHQVSSGIRDFLRSKWPTPLPYEIPAANDSPDLSEGEKNDFGSPSFSKPFYDKASFSRSTISPRTKGSFSFSSSPPSPPAKSNTEQNRQFYDRFEQTRSRQEQQAAEESQAYDFRYLGQVFGLFLAAEKEGTFYLIDQHAAHERILYERFVAGASHKQQLLIPKRLQLDDEGKTLLQGQIDYYRGLGIVIEGEKEGDNLLLTALPESCVHLEKEITTFIESQETGSDGFSERIFANLACKAAIKEGEFLPPETAKKIIAGTFALKQHRCPHGRPLYFSVTEKELYKAVGRTF